MNTEEIAKIAHEINREYCKALGDFSQLPWDNAPDWQKNSAISGVKMHIKKPEAGPEESHQSWMDQKIKEGWKFGEIKDEEEKTHPCIVEFNKLPKEQQAKDFIFRAIVHLLKNK